MNEKAVFGNLNVLGLFRGSSSRVASLFPWRAREVEATVGTA
ncbi:hypothetical protein BRCON_2798 [Candidatus Sumerlaea chitinivorans]|uniref:Uncharacterized protein n=1 Tax=Sumerlaea chitinivorans TaxID=2250252 RepID=A0A2Z4Y8I0_SUMC1|nr:hypothetical protein BRCON_2798 [Candidatus Sumerlaea chitinivorans]